jgi:alpha-beta hydrolase superfamily lysophospholipase
MQTHRFRVQGQMSRRGVDALAPAWRRGHHGDMPTTEYDVHPGFVNELRAVPEFGAFMAAFPLLQLAPRGDGHPVLVLPGLGAGDRSTRPLRWFLRSRGYWVHGWKLGTNQGPDERTTRGLARRLDELADQHGQAVSLVGWSMGGVYARFLARRTPHSVRLVITLGSPVTIRGAQAPLAVPTTSIYSRTDAIVPYHLSLDPPGPQRENIEVRGSHLGLGHNPAVAIVVADRLALPEGAWRPFHPSALLRNLYPHPRET